MADHEQWQIRVVPAGHPATPQDVLAKLAADDHYQVRSWVVRNLATNPAILSYILNNDPDPGIATYARLRLNEVSEADG